MKCEYCNKKIKGNFNKRHCNSKCYYKKNEKKIRERSRKHYHEIRHNLCKCGNKKYISSKQCLKCHGLHKHRFQLSRSSLK